MILVHSGCLVLSLLMSLSITSEVLADTCESGELRLSLLYRNFIGGGVLEICRGFNESGGVIGGVWRNVCLLQDRRYGNRTSGVINARVVCEQLKSQNSWNFNISDIILRPKDFFLNVERYSFVSTYDSFIRPTCKGHEERLKDCQVEYTQSQSTSYNYYGDDSCDYDGIICIPADKSILPACSSDEIHCVNGICADNRRSCDGTDHCGDNSDETQQLCLQKEMEEERIVNNDAQVKLDISVGVSVGVPLIIAALWLVVLVMCMLIPRCPLGRVYRSKPHPNSTSHTHNDSQSDHDHAEALLSQSHQTH